MDIFEDYLKSIKTCRISEITEGTYRNKLQDLLETIAKEINKKIEIIHEPKREGKFGSPDYKVVITDNIIGYVENKPIGEDLEKVIRSEQIKKYKELSDNLIVTNYIEFIWLKDGKVAKRENLSYLTDFERKKIKPDLIRETAVKELIKNFFSQAPKGISSTKKLAEALSIRARLLKNFLFEELRRQEREHTEGKLYGLFQTFKKYVFNELSIEEFSDTFAQNLVYGLFLAKLNAKTDSVNLYNAKKYISSSFELIKELVGFLDELDKEEYIETRWIVEEVLTVMNNLDIDSIVRTLSFNKNIRDSVDYTTRDPYVYFYEDFLSIYDKALKKSKGVYYTPPQIVNFIIRSINNVLKNTFKIEYGFADYKKVTVLDFATGTGTFLLEIFRIILDQYSETGKVDLIIKDHILKNIYGFEYLIAPYTIAHLKLYQFLKDNGYVLDNNERIQIFLTNTLEPSGEQLDIHLLPSLINETKFAQDIRDKPILIIVGNPPYSVKSKNNGVWIKNKIRDYYFVDGIPINETSSKALQDDYVKFIRFAQHKMENIKEGIVGIITNHSFLSNPSFKGMRRSLMQSFNQMFFLDLHGKQKENNPNNGKDENVFNIERGVAISFLIKNEKLGKKIHYASFWGTKKEKFKNCLENTIDSINWEVLTPEKPSYLFYPEDKKLKNIYKKGYLLKDIFKISGTGITTAHDRFVIDFEKDTLLKKFNEFKVFKGNVNELHLKFNVKKKKGWDILKGYGTLKEIENLDSLIKKIQYRPFDVRYIFYENHLVWRTVKKVMQHMLKDNIALISARSNKSSNMDHFFFTKFITEAKCGEATTQSQIFPVYIYENNIDRVENFTQDFRRYINSLYKKYFKPEEIIGYIYGILYSPSYRKKYVQFLKFDFPRIPFTEDIKIFKLLSDVGWKLIQVHLKNEILKEDFCIFPIKGSNKVEKINFRDNKIFINNLQFFDNITEEIFNFQIGGYRVLSEYLKKRRERILSLEDIENVENIIKVLAFTIDQMKKIDDLTKDWI